jgi:hypothetical protein
MMIVVVIMMMMMVVMLCKCKGDYCDIIGQNVEYQSLPSLLSGVFYLW